MAKATVTFSKRFLELPDTILEVINDELDPIGKMMVTQVKGETRSGNQLVEDGTKVRQPPLASGSVDNRKRLSNMNSTHPTYAPGRSNLTFSGQLIDAVSYDAKPGKDPRIDLMVEDTTRSPYTTSKEGNHSKPLSNRDLAKYLAEKGRKFLAVNQSMKKRASDMLQRAFRRKLRRV